MRQQTWDGSRPAQIENIKTTIPIYCQGRLGTGKINELLLRKTEEISDSFQILFVISSSREKRKR